MIKEGVGIGGDQNVILQISQSIVAGNLTDDGSGAGVSLRSGGSFFIEDSGFVNNSSGSNTGGGAVAVSGVATIERSLLANNSTVEGIGDAIASVGSMTLMDSTVFGRSGPYNSMSTGAIWTSGELTLQGSTVYW